MGGKSTQTQQQSSTTQPWQQAQPALQGLLGKLEGQINTSGLSPTSSNALDTLAENAKGGNPYAVGIDGLTRDLLAGGGATDQADALKQNQLTFEQRLGPYADPNYTSLNNPALRAALDQIRDDTTNATRGMFAAGGRSFSPDEAMAIGRGVSAGQAPLILNQFNQDQTLKQNAAKSIYDAGTGTGGLLAGLRQQGVANAQAGAGLVPTALEAANYSPLQALQIDQLRKSIPTEQLGLLAQIGIPIAGLGSQTSGTATGTNQMSGADQALKISQAGLNFGKLLFGGMG